MSLSFPLASRFRGYLPVVIDIETGGFNASEHAMLEFAAVLLDYDGAHLTPARTLHYHIEPAEGTVIDPAAIKFNGIDPYNPLRGAIPEGEALRDFYREIRHTMRMESCTRAVVVAHNAAFDHGFLSAATARQQIKRSPFHPFSSIDTASLSALAFGHNVLSRACELAGIEFDAGQAHTAIYDAEQTARLFCEIVNRWQRLGGWPLPESDVDADNRADKTGY